MSREIDTSKPGKLSLDDRLYLQDRGMLPEGAKPVTQKDRERLAEESGPQEESLIVENAGQDPTAEEEDDSEDDVEETPYDEWSGDELREELESRDLSKSGTNAEMRQRLVEDDESNED